MSNVGTRLVRSGLMPAARAPRLTSVNCLRSTTCPSSVLWRASTFNNKVHLDHVVNGLYRDLNTAGASAS